MKVCQHAGKFSFDNGTTNKHGRLKRRKCIDCKMHIILGIKHITKHVKEKCLDLESFPCYVMILFDHNHNHFSARSLSHNSISERAETDYINLFKRGMSVTDAYNSYRAAITENFVA